MNQLKIVAANGAPIHKCRNLKRKFYNCHRKMYFNQECILHKLTPKFCKSHNPNYLYGTKLYICMYMFYVRQCF